MGIYDRDYARPEGYGQQYSMGGGFRSIPPVVKWLLIINFALFIIDNLLFSDLLPDNPKIRFTILDQYFSVFPASWGMALQPWRVITYQFLHADVGHIVFNLFALYMFGPFVERTWGSKAFLKFYLISGAAGGFLYTLLARLNILEIGPMVGASGAIYGILAVVALMFPKMRVLLFFIIPMTLSWAVILVIILSLLFIFSGINAGGELAHLTGLAVGFIYVKYKPLLTAWRMQRKKGAWAEKIQQEQRFQQEVDRILEKVHREGINCLSEKEKNMLQEATRREQRQSHP